MAERAIIPRLDVLVMTRHVYPFGQRVQFILQGTVSYLYGNTWTRQVVCLGIVAAKIESMGMWLDG